MVRAEAEKFFAAKKLCSIKSHSLSGRARPETFGQGLTHLSCRVSADALAARTSFRLSSFDHHQLLFHFCFHTRTSTSIQEQHHHHLQAEMLGGGECVIVDAAL